MPICDVTSSSTRLHWATKELREAWQEARKHWDDETANEFERRYLDPILPHLRLLFAELNELRATYDKAEKDCSDTMLSDT
jgi:hypothetical protein